MLRNISLEGYLYFDQESLKKSEKFFLDIKTINRKYMWFKKLPFFFFLHSKIFCSKVKIECRWEKFRTKILNSSILNNPQLSNISKKILHEIYKHRKIGVLQYKLSRIFNLESNVIYHYLLILLNFSLIKKELSNSNLKSKFSNAILIKPKFYLEYKKINYNPEKLEKYINKNIVFSLIQNIAKISARIKKIITQKKIKYGILSFYKNINKIQKKKIHRIWRKTKEKCYKANLFNILPNFNLIFHEKNNFSKHMCENTGEMQTNKLKSEKFEKNIWQLILLFYIHPEIRVWKIFKNYNIQNITSPILLHIFRGYVTYKFVQNILKNFEKYKGISKKLQQIGRQKIMHFYHKKKFYSNNYTFVNLNNKIKKGFTEQFLKRRVTLLTWIKDRLIEMKELGKEIAYFENKGLKKVDSKVIRRVLSNLINFGYIKIIKIYIQLNSIRTKIFEFIVDKNCQNFFIRKISKLTFFSKKKNKTAFNNYFELKKNIKEKISSIEKILFLIFSFYFFDVNYVFCFLSSKFIYLRTTFINVFNFKKNFKINVIYINKELNIFKNRFFLLIHFFRSKILNKNSNLITKNLNQQLYKKNKIFNFFLSKHFFFDFDVYLNIIKSKINDQTLYVFKSWKKFLIFNFNENKIYKKRFIYSRINETKIKHSVKKRNIYLSLPKFYFFLKPVIIFSWNFFKFWNFFINYRKKSLNKKKQSVIVDKKGNLDIFKCKWDCELDTKIYNQYILNFNIKNNKSKKLRIFRLKILKRRIKGLSSISNVKFASFFFKKCSKKRKSKFFIKPIFFFYQIIKRSLELPNNKFILNIQKIKNNSHKFIQESKKKKNIFSKKLFLHFIFNFYTGIYLMNIKTNSAILSLFYLGNIIFSIQKVIQKKTNKFSENYFKLFKTRKNEIIELNDSFSGIDSLKKNQKKKTKKNWIFFWDNKILNTTIITRQNFFSKFNKHKIIFSPFFVKNKRSFNNLGNILNKKIISNIFNTIEARLIFYNFRYLNFEKSKKFFKKKNTNKNVFLLVNYTVNFFNLKKFKKNIFNLFYSFKNFFKIMLNIYIKQFSYIIEKITYRIKNSFRYMNITLYIIFWENSFQFSYLQKKNKISLEMTIYMINQNKNSFLSPKYEGIKKYLLYFYIFFNFFTEKNILFSKVAKYLISNLIFEKFLKILFNEEKTILIGIFGKTNNKIPNQISLNLIRNLSNFINIPHLVFFQPKI